MSIQAVWLNRYTFSVHLHSAGWNPTAGIYIFCGVTPQNQWRPLYIGQANDFRSRFGNHETWPGALALGATHIHAMVVPLQAHRDQIEQELIRAYDPPLNVHHRPALGIWK
jgi:excinuclease UvrABC nuclease subunit